jgi:hypothetical protein
MLGWGALFCPPGLTAPFACGLVERHGGHFVMAGGH